MKRASENWGYRIHAGEIITHGGYEGHAGYSHPHWNVYKSWQGAGGLLFKAYVEQKRNFVAPINAKQAVRILVPA